MLDIRKMEIIFGLLAILFMALCLRFMFIEYVKFCKEYVEEEEKRREEEKKELLQEIEKLLHSKKRG